MPRPAPSCHGRLRHWETVAWAARHLNDDGNDLAVETGQAVASTLGLLRAPLRQGRYGGQFQDGDCCAWR